MMGCLHYCLLVVPHHDLLHNMLLQAVLLLHDVAEAAAAAT